MLESKISDVKEEFALALKIFGQDLYFATLTGTYAYGDFSKESDIDIFAVLKPSNASKELLEKRKAFTEEYFRIHKKFNLKPDYLFPGEIISKDMLNDALKGRGFDVSYGLPYLKPITTEEEWTPEREYRCWLSMAAFNNNQFIEGNKEEFQKARIAAASEISKFLLYDSKISSTKSANQIRNEILAGIIKGGKEYLGIRERHSLSEFVKDYESLFPSIVNELNSNKIIHSHNSSIVIYESKIMEDMKVMADYITNKRFKSVPLFKWEDVR